MTLYEIMILVHYATRNTDYEGTEPIAQQTIDWFVAEGLLRRVGPHEVVVHSTPTEKHPNYLATDRLRCYVAALQAIPLPIWQVILKAGE